MIIGFAGKKYSGKTASANFLKYIYGDEAVVLSFATPLKHICKYLFNLSDEQLTTKKEDIDFRYDKTPRQILQIVGTDMFRKEFPSVWIDFMGRELHNNRGKHIFIDDVRFENEARLISDFQGEVVKIISRGKSDDSHFSESVELTDDHIIDNSGSLVELYKNLLTLI